MAHIKYRRWYCNLITKARVRDPNEIDGEWHHIKPRALNGSNRKFNIVKLTYREHFLAHWLLAKFNKGEAKRKMQHAFFRICNRGEIITGWRYEIARREKRKVTKGQPKGFKNGFKKGNKYGHRFKKGEGPRTKFQKGHTYGFIKGHKESKRTSAKRSVTMMGHKISNETKIKIGIAVHAAAINRRLI
jgi:hypothetical protein